MLQPVRRALLSVWDKEGLLPLARALAGHGVELFSTGGTRALLEADGLPVREVGELTGRPEAFGGRMKTLSFEVASALLFHRTRDAAEAEALGVSAIDLVVVNLYPFEQYRDKGLDDADLIEYIDIGGPTMIRAAAKNYAAVAVLTAPDQYAGFIAELEAQGGQTRLETRRALMAAAFQRTSAYDTAIAAHMSGGAKPLPRPVGPPRPLRYGENPHQRAALTPLGGPDPLDRVIGGKELSYNNLLDVEAALHAIEGQGEDGVAVAVVKHGNPCGLAVAATGADALELAWAGDPVSAFGSVISFSRAVEAADLAPLHLDDKARRRFVEVIVAPGFSAEAQALAAHHKTLRLVRWSVAELMATPDRRFVLGQLLEQDRDLQLAEGWAHMAGPARDLDEGLAAFGVRACRSVKSNAIVIVRRTAEGALQLLGMGAGQPNRVRSAEIAVARAAATAPGALGDGCAISDAFLPFRDTLDVLAEAGVQVLIQPGGSLRDPEVAAAADARGVTLIRTGTRHFRH
jgi:phosphoribosylaminoimidazolecarboxamide formyltransferase/IMP cyclohydrolase